MEALRRQGGKEKGGMERNRRGGSSSVVKASPYL